jgi:imidazoleglycerol phosphate dehydratase HisB
MSAKLVTTFEDLRAHVHSVTDPYGRILGFLDQSRYFFFQVAPQLYSRGGVDPRPDPQHIRNTNNAGNRTPTSRSLARNFDHYTIEAVYFLLHNIYKFSSYLTGSTIHLRCVARNSDHYIIEAVYFLLHNIYKFSSYLTGSTIHLRYVARNSDHYTIEAVYFLLHNIHKFSSYLTGSTIHLRCVAGNSDHYTIEAVYFLLHNIHKFSSYLT